MYSWSNIIDYVGNIGLKLANLGLVYNRALHVLHFSCFRFKKRDYEGYEDIKLLQKIESSHSDPIVTGDRNADVGKPMHHSVQPPRHRNPH